MNAFEEPLLLPAELTDALAVTKGAWEQWEREPDNLRQLHVQWVAKPRRARERRARAEVTAYYTTHGGLPQAFPRLGIVENILNAISWW